MIILASFLHNYRLIFHPPHNPITTSTKRNRLELMKQIYNADTPFFWEEVKSTDDVEDARGGTCLQGGAVKLSDCPTLSVVHDFCGSGEGRATQDAAADRSDSNRNSCLSVCTFASRLVLNNLLPSRLAKYQSSNLSVLYLTQTRHGRFFAWLY